MLNMLKCRLCCINEVLHESTALELREDCPDAPQMAQLIKRNLKIELDPTDTQLLSSKICSNCFSQLDTFRLFCLYVESQQKFLNHQDRDPSLSNIYDEKNVVIPECSEDLVLLSDEEILPDASYALSPDDGVEKEGNEADVVYEVEDSSSLSEDDLVGQKKKTDASPNGNVGKSLHNPEMEIQVSESQSITLQEAQSSIITPKFQCYLCQKNLASNRNLVNHLKTKHVDREEYPFVCDVCGGKFGIVRHLKCHQAVHRPREFVCEICKIEYYRKPSLRSHIKKSHINVSSGKESESRPSLDGHGNGRVYMCEICSESFVESEVSKHIDKHIIDTSQSR